MESSAVFRSFHCAVGTVAQVNSLVDRSIVIPMYTAASKSRRGTHLKCTKAPESTLAATSNGVSSDSCPKATVEKKKRSATFPSGLEALVLEVCDETEVAELKLKIGDFEMNLRRNIGATKTPPLVSPLTPPPVPSEPMVASDPAPLPTPPVSTKTSSASTNPFKSDTVEKLPKLVALEASGATTYVLALSASVGSFRKGRLAKGKRQAPICREGVVIKEGQVIGYLEQFGSEVPVKSDVAGEILKVLVEDGDAVGYGDPLLAVLPSFHGIK